ncbi:hypothetical protein [Rhizobium sp. NLR22b]|uniref:hypothetical protein n=1 Tax=Rhizobium sp. NLR22b TaxID=2731115 RepID=UPI001C830750|nr:hypothetical protein [Rhizobium sp. NLR22b]
MSDITKRRADDCADEDGFALLAVLAFLLLFAALLIPFSSAARLAALTSHHSFERSRLAYAAEAINAYTAMKLETDGAWAATIAGEASGRSCASGDAIVTLRILDHAGLIDLNVAGLATIEAGLAALGLTAPQVTDVASAVILFRSRQSSNSPIPAKSEPEYGFKHAPFEDVVELLDFPEMRRFSPEQISEIFTVDSHSAAVSREFASASLRSHLTDVSGEIRHRLQLSGTYTLATKINSQGEWATDARIVVTGDGRQTNRRVWALPLSSISRRGLSDCGLLLGPDAASWLKEAL